MLIATKRIKIFVEDGKLVIMVENTMLYNVSLNEVVRTIYPNHAAVLFHILNNDLNLLMRFCEDLTSVEPTAPDNPASPFDLMGDIEPGKQEKLL
jgi:hypothetical protein